MSEQFDRAVEDVKAILAMADQINGLDPIAMHDLCLHLADAVASERRKESSTGQKEQMPCRVNELRLGDLEVLVREFMGNR